MNVATAPLLHALAELATTPRTAVLIALLVIAAVIDWRTFRIPNWLTAGGMVFGLMHAAFVNVPGQPGLLSAVGGLGLGLALLLPLYALRVMGAGDVKLMAMAGAFLGVPDILFAVLSTFVAGGVAAVLFAAWRGSAGRLLANLRDMVQSFAFAAVAGRGAGSAAAAPARASIGKLPYGVSIAAGTLVCLLILQLARA
jgi:prepilin peptidase CpaA